MGLSNLVIKKETVEVSGVGVELRGLAFYDIATLVNKHRKVLEDLFLTYTDPNGPGLSLDKQGTLILELLIVAPDLMTDIICNAAEEPDAASVVRALPLETQLILLEKISRLTLEANGGLGKIIEIVNRLAVEIRASLKVQRR